MTTEASIGYGTLFKTDNGNSPAAWDTLAEVTSISPPKMSRDSIDATHEQSPNAWREFIAGLKDGGEVSLDLNFIPGGSAADDLTAELALAGSAATKSRLIVFPDGSQFEFDAFLTGFEPDAPLDDKMTGTATFKVTGEPVLTQ
jgi:predicted secreted protein